MLNKLEKRYRRHKRSRARVFGTSSRPRLSVFRSLKHIYAQIIDDEKRETLLSASDLEIKPKTNGQKQKTKIKEAETESGLGFLKGKVAVAYEVGKLLAQKALKANIKKVVFDRGGFKYHGRIKALADGAREGGLKF